MQPIPATLRALAALAAITALAGCGPSYPDIMPPPRPPPPPEPPAQSIAVDSTAATTTQSAPMPEWARRGSGAALQQPGRVLIGIGTIEHREDMASARKYAGARAVHDLWRAWQSYLDLMALDLYGGDALPRGNWQPPPWSGRGDPSPGMEIVETRSSGETIFALARVSLDTVLEHFAGQNDPELTAHVRQRADAIHDQLLHRAPSRHLRPTTVSDVAVGGNHTCAIATNRQVFCWGSGAVGQLGHLWPPGHRSHPGPLAVAGASQVASGGLFSCAIIPGGQVSCWGQGRLGQLGYDGQKLTKELQWDIPYSDTPALVPGLRDIRQLALGYTHACALAANGTVWCWGDAAHGKLGYEVQTDCSRHKKLPLPCGPRARRVTSLSGVTRLAAGYDFTCALSGGHVLCWGSSQFGQIPDYQSDCPGRPGGPCTIRPTIVDGLEDIVGVAAGHRFACAWDQAGSLWCWGNNPRGQLGGRPGDGCGGRSAGICPQRPTAVPGFGPGLSPVRDVAIGAYSACAVHGAGEVSCWGTSDSSLFGGPPGVICAEASCATPPSRIPGLRDIREISLQGDTACALDRAGGLYCWGRNLSGNVGDGTQLPRSSPARIGFPVSLSGRKRSGQ